MSEQQARDNGEAIRARGAELGFTFDMDRRRHVWNTFDAHRLLHWAGLEALGKQRALKHAMLRAYFTDGENVADHDVLARLAESAGLDGGRARARKSVVSGKSVSVRVVLGGRRDIKKKKRDSN